MLKIRFTHNIFFDDDVDDDTMQSVSPLSINYLSLNIINSHVCHVLKLLLLIGTDECLMKSVVNRVAVQLAKAMKEKGMAMLVNHGISEEKVFITSFTLIYTLLRYYFKNLYLKSFISSLVCQLS